MRGAEEALVPFPEFSEIAGRLNVPVATIEARAREARALVAYLLPEDVIGATYFVDRWRGTYLFIIEVPIGDGQPGVWAFVGCKLPLALYTVPGDTDLQALDRAALAMKSLADGRRAIPLVNQKVLISGSWKVVEMEAKVADRLTQQSEMFHEWLMDHVE